MAPSVYILLHRDASGTSTVLSVFSELPDANAACLEYAVEAKVETGAKSPRALQRWEAPDGASCWVEKHTVVPPKSTLAAPRPASPQRKNSSLYDNDDDDIIEVQDKEGNYD